MYAPGAEPLKLFTLTRYSSGDPVVREATLGGVASAAAAIISNPIDIVRVRRQLGSLPAAAPKSINAGLGPAMIYNVVLNSTRFSLFYAVDDRLGPIAGGLLAGGVAGFISSPFARWRTLRQAGESSASLMTRPFAGALPWAFRNAGHTACIFYLFAATSKALEERSASAQLPPTLRHLAGSLVAATTSCFLMNPLDVYCTRQYAATGSGAIAPPAAPARVASSLLASGYAGLGANMLRTVPHTVLTFVLVGALRVRLERVAALDAASLSQLRPRETEAQLRALVPNAPAVARTVTQGSRVVR